MIYETLKWLHVGCVIVSGTGFVARGALMLADSPLLRTRFLRIAPHVVDTLLLTAGVAMATIARVSPLQHPWLAAKIGALLVYIALGAAALRPGRSRLVRAAAFAAAVLVFGYIVGTAVQRSPGWLLTAI